MKSWQTPVSLRGLRVQILLWTILPFIILLIALSLTGIRSHQNSMRLLVVQRNDSLVRALAGEVAIQLDRYTVGLSVLAGSGRLDPRDPEATSLALADAERVLPEATLLVIDATGRVVVGPDRVPAWVEEVTKQLPEAPTGQVLVTTAGDGRVVVWRIPLASGRGWLVAGVPVEALGLSRLLNTEHLSEQGLLALVDGEGRVLYAQGPGPLEAEAEKWPGVMQALTGQSGVFFVMTPQGEQVVAYAPVSSVGWALIIREPWESLAAPLLRFDRVMPFVLLVATVISLLTLFFGLRYVVRPLQRLGMQADRIGQGDFSAAREPVGGVREIEELRQTLDRMAQQVQRYQVALQGYLGAMTRAQEEERARLARELHDETIQSLIALGQRVQMVQRTLSRDPTRAAERLAELRGMISDAVEEVRRFSRALRPLYLEELGLVPALEMLANEAQASFRVRGAPRRLTTDQELALYRIAQEALSNALRHAQARHISMELAFDEEAVTLRVWDDGKGFEVPDRFADLARKGHFGLMGMHERAQLVGGRLTVISAPGRGAMVEVSLKS